MSRFTILFLLLVVVCSTWAHHHIKHEHRDKCSKFVSLTDAEIEDILDKRVLPNKKHGFCFIGCILKLKEVMTSTFEIIYDKAVELVDLNTKEAQNELFKTEHPTKIKIVEECYKKGVGKDECEVAEMFMKCAAKKKLEYGVTTRIW